MYNDPNYQAPEPYPPYSASYSAPPNPETGNDAPPPGSVPPPPQQPYPGYPPYGNYQAYYNGPMAPSQSGWAIASLVCSLVGLFIVPVIGSILAVIFGHMGLNEIKNSNGRIEGRGLAIAGLIIGYGALALFVLGVILFIVAMIAFSTSNPTPTPSY